MKRLLCFVLVLICGCAVFPPAAAQLRFVKEVDTVQDMKNLNTADVHKAAFVKGRLTFGDSFAGLFYWDSTNTIATNLWTIFKGKTTGAELVTGRWVRAKINGLILDTSGNVNLAASTSLIVDGTVTAADVSATTVDATTIEASGKVATADGSAANPSLTFSGDLDSGFYRSGANAVNLSLGGVSRAAFATTGLTLSGSLTATDATLSGTLTGTDISGTTIDGTTIEAFTRFLSAAGSAGTPSYSFSGDQNTGLFSQAADAIGYSLAGTERFRMTTGQLLGVAGSAAAPAWSFIGDPNTGFYNYVADAIGISLGGIANYTITTSGIYPFTGNAVDLGGVGAGSGFRSGFFETRVQVGAGSAGAPSYTILGDLNSGFYQVGADSIGLSLGGVNRVTWTTTGQTITGDLAVSGTFAPSVLTVGAGSAGAPSISFTGDPNTGFYNLATDQIGVSAGGVLRATYSVTGLELVGSLTAGGQVLAPSGSTTAPGLSFSLDPNSGFYRSASDEISLTLGGTTDLIWTTTTMSYTGDFGVTGNANVSGILGIGDGSVGAPSITFNSDPNTGLYSSGANELAVTINGTLNARFTATELVLAGGIDASTGPIVGGSLAGGIITASLKSESPLFELDDDGSIANPALTWGTDSDTGIYRDSANTIGFTANATEIVLIHPSGVTVTGALTASTSIGTGGGVTATTQVALTGTGSAITWTSGNGVPVHAAFNGSYHSRLDGGAGSTFYVHEGGGWVAK